MKSTSALILTIICAITAHVSTYLEPSLLKYLITGIGALSAIIGGMILYYLRRTFTKEYQSTDWESTDGAYTLSIAKSEHKKDKPSVACEIYVSENRGWNKVAVSEEVTEDNNVKITINSDPKDLGKFRVRIK